VPLDTPAFFAISFIPTLEFILSNIRVTKKI
jgi:hypothetical protein